MTDRLEAAIAAAHATYYASDRTPPSPGLRNAVRAALEAADEWDEATRHDRERGYDQPMAERSAEAYALTKGAPLVHAKAADT